MRSKKHEYQLFDSSALQCIQLNKTGYAFFVVKHAVDKCASGAVGIKIAEKLYQAMRHTRT